MAKARTGRLASIGAPSLSLRSAYGVLVRLSRIRVKNFRNLVDIDVPLAQHTVVVGENRSGKSNLLHAVRLVLDSSVSAEQRRLKPEDFWEGLSAGSDDAMSAGEIIEVSLDITDFGDEPAVITALGDALVIGEPLSLDPPMSRV